MIMTIKSNSLAKTLSEMERLVFTYSNDVNKIKDLSIEDFFNLVSKRIIYKKDPKNAELLMRPSILLQRGAGDCDDKTIICLCYFIENRIKCGYSIVSERIDKEYHHIFPFIILSGKQCDFDATYSSNRLGQSRNNYTARIDKIIYNGENLNEVNNFRR